MAAPIDIAETFRARLLRREAAATRAVVRAYLEAAASIKKRIDAMLMVDSLSENQALILARLQNLQLQILSEIRRFSFAATSTVAGAEIDAQALSEAQTTEILLAFNKLPTAAIEGLVGNFQPSARLFNLFESIGAGLSQSARSILVSGLSQGLSPRKVARQLRDSLGIGMNRAMTISRTEILNSFRTATSQTFKNNRDVVLGWVWMASLGPRCCAMCTALNGQHFTVDEPMISHPNCRCTQLPDTGGTRIQSGSAWFATQDEDLQREILGDAAWRAYQAGEVDLADFVGRNNGGYYRRSLKNILGTGAVPFYKRAA